MSAANVAFAIAAILVDDDRGGKGLEWREKLEFAHAAGKIENQVRRDGCCWK